MILLNRKNISTISYPNRIIQFGEGNFLRAFIDWMVQEMNDKINYNTGITLVQPIAQGMVANLNEQDFLYHLILKGLVNGEAQRFVKRIEVINDGVNPYTHFDKYLGLAEDLNNRFIVSNTTEAGICFDSADKFTDCPANSYPAKLTQLLFHRYKLTLGSVDKGFIIIPCELIEGNGEKLKECVLKYTHLWGLGDSFRDWIVISNIFCNTLVDRIVPGFPKDSIAEIQQEIGFDDRMVVEGEIFHLLVIEAPESVRSEFPADKAGLNVLFVPSIKPYRDRKVTLLNGPHTVLSPVGYLSGLNTVKECIDDIIVGSFVRKAMFEELLVSLDLPESELQLFANDVLDRFLNPYVKHQLTSIMLNSFSKYKTRDLPAVKIYLNRKGTLPKALVLGLAAICVYYKGGKRGVDLIQPNDETSVIELLSKLWNTSPESVARGVLSSELVWGEDLTKVKGLELLLNSFILSILEKGMNQTLEEVLESYYHQEIDLNAD